MSDGRVTGIRAPSAAAGKPGEITAPLIIGADGKHSPVARTVVPAGTDQRPAPLRRRVSPTGIGPRDPWWRNVRADRRAIGVWPTNDGSRSRTSRCPPPSSPSSARMATSDPARPSNGLATLASASGPRRAEHVRATSDLPNVYPPPIRARLGARRRRRPRHGPDHRPGHRARAARRRVAGGRVVAGRGARPRMTHLPPTTRRDAAPCDVRLHDRARRSADPAARSYSPVLAASPGPTSSSACSPVRCRSTTTSRRDTRPPRWRARRRIGRRARNCRRREETAASAAIDARLAKPAGAPTVGPGA